MVWSMVREVCYSDGLLEARRYQVVTAVPLHLPSVRGVSDGERDDRDQEIGYLLEYLTVRAVSC